VNYTAGYSAIPADIAEACVELVALRYRQRQNIGQSSKHLATGETVSYDRRAMPDWIRDVIARYKRNIPV
jgi:hypothetical protein